MGSKPIGLSASRGAAILGLSQWTSPFEVWQRIQEEINPGFNSLHGYVMPEFVDNPFTRWGHAFEDSIIHLAEEKRGKKIEDRERLFTGVEIDEKYSFITCHIDGWYCNDSDYFELHEGKTTQAWSWKKKWGDPGTDRVPQDYGVQAQHQMLCTGAEEVIFSLLVLPESPEVWEEMGWSVESDDQYGLLLKNSITSKERNIEQWADSLAEMGFFHQYTVPRNQDAIDLMVEHYTEFWQKNIIEQIPPDANNYDDLRRMIPNPCGTIIIDEQIEEWYAEYKDIPDEIKQVDKRKEQLKVLILKRAKDIEPIIDDESTDKWIFVNSKGEKCGQYGMTKKGLAFR